MVFSIVGFHDFILFTLFYGTIIGSVVDVDLNKKMFKFSNKFSSWLLPSFASLSTVPSDDIKKNIIMGCNFSSDEMDINSEYLHAGSVTFLSFEEF